MDELLPQSGKDAEYDEIVAEISRIEQELRENLEELETKVG
jgi:hypothetical protein